jgi:polyhydroxyalkanoate synthase
MRKQHADICLGPDEWFVGARRREGSWWPAWTEWLGRLSSPERIAPPGFGDTGSGREPLCDAPGTYVLQR